MTGEFRFQAGYRKGNGRAMVKVWVEKEMRNLKRMQTAGIPCPEPVALRENVLVLDWIGDADGWPAQRLRDVEFAESEAAGETPAVYDRWTEVYITCIAYMRRLYHTCRLVHGDLSEYNLLFHNSTLYVIDVSQGVEHDHPNSLEFLRMDVKNVSSFFRTKGVETLPERRVYAFITSTSTTKNEGVEIVEMETRLKALLKERQSLTPEQRQKDEEDNVVWREQYIPQTLQQVFDIERDGDMVLKGEGQKLVYQSLLADDVVGAKLDAQSESEQSGSDDDSDRSESEDDLDPSRSAGQHKPRGKRFVDRDVKKVGQSSSSRYRTPVRSSVSLL